MPEIVPVELTLPSGRWYTLHQRGWDDADDDSLAFLGRGHRVFAFATPEELAAYVGAHDDHHLAASPLWAEVRYRFASGFVPAGDDRHDLVTAGNGRAGRSTRVLVADLLDYLGIDVLADPVADLLPRGGTLTGLPADVEHGRTRLRDAPWEWVLTQLEAAVGPPVGADDEGPASHLTPLETVAPGVEVVWLGLAGEGAFTLVSDEGDGAVTFLGEPGELRAARSVEDLTGYLADGADRFLDVAPWWALRGRLDLDYEPYEDNVTDLDEVAGLIGPDLDREGAHVLLASWGQLRQLAEWTGSEAAIAALAEDAPLGRFVVRDALDLSAGSFSVRARLAAVDLDAVRGAWQDCLAAIAEQVVWVGPAADAGP